MDAPFSGFVFKIQSNMDPAHRDHVAFVRVCSGHFRRGVTVTHTETGRTFSTKYAASMFGSDRDTIDDAYPGDVIGLVNAGDLRIGSSLYEAEPVSYPPIATLAPELFARVRARDTANYKQFHRGLEQMEREGVVHVLRDPGGDPTPILAAVGQMQFEVFSHRLEHEFGAAVALEPTAHTVARRTDVTTADHLKSFRGVLVLVQRDGTMLALFESAWVLQQVEADHPDWRLDHIVIEAG